MRDWNVIVTIRGNRFRSACEQLEPLGRVKRTRYYNVLAVKVDDVPGFMETLRDWMTTFPDTAEAIARVAPVADAFTYQSVEEFVTRARESLGRLIPRLAGRRFHLRIHRRGGKETLGHCGQEDFLGGLLFEALEQAGSPGELDFDDPDYIVAVETLDDRAGVAIWSREDLRRYPFLKLD